MRVPAFFVSALVVPLIVASAAATTITVGPGGRYTALDQVPWPSLAPGDRVTILPGIVQANAVAIGAHGTAIAPITIAALDGTRPVIGNTILFDGAAHLVVEGFTVEGAQQAGIALTHGSTDITVRNMVLRRNGAGLWMGDGAGASHRIVENEFSQNHGNGIGVDRIANPPGEETVFARNRIVGNEWAGIAVTGTGFIAEENTITGNGWNLPGTSGIQLYAGGFRGSPRLIGMGSRNVLRYNTISGQRDSAEYDGNGIEADLWCDDNEISYNVIYGNDGAGIIVFNGARNRVFNNTVFGNARDSGRTHPDHAEIAIIGDEKIDHVDGNAVHNNVAVANAPGGVAILVNGNAADRHQVLGGNLIYNASGGPAYQWVKRADRDPAAWNRLTSAETPDVVADPLFIDPGNPPDGLRPGAASPAIARGARLGLARDHAGRPLPADRPPSLGAFESEN